MNGRHVLVLGPDGVGKTTALAALADDLHRRGLRVHRHHWRVRWRAAATQAVRPVTDPHGKPAYGQLLSTIKLVYLLLLAWPAHWRRVVPPLRRGDWVLQDRGPADLACDPKRYRYGGSRRLARLWVRLMPRPDITIVLTADPAVILARKAEVAEAELTTLVAAYRAVTGGKVVQIDAAADPDVVADRLRAIALEGVL